MVLTLINILSFINSIVLTTVASMGLCCTRQVSKPSLLQLVAPLFFFCQLFLFLKIYFVDLEIFMIEICMFLSVYSNHLLASAVEKKKMMINY